MYQNEVREEPLKNIFSKEACLLFILVATTESGTLGETGHFVLSQFKSCHAWIFLGIKISI